jgi:hypothetical protein
MAVVDGGEVDHLAGERATAQFDVDGMKVAWAGSRHAVEVNDRMARLVASDPVSTHPLFPLQFDLAAPHHGRWISVLGRPICSLLPVIRLQHVLYWLLLRRIRSTCIARDLFHNIPQPHRTIIVCCAHYSLVYPGGLPASDITSFGCFTSPVSSH